jgi:predicted flap endonuclease-1-like 5' DNA nuclease
MMDDVPMKGAPLLAGWVIAAAVAVAATGICMVIFGFNIPQATFVAAVLFVVVGLILGLPPRTEVTAEAPATAAHTPVMAAPAMAAPVAAAPVMAAQVAAQKPQGLTAARGGKPDDLKIIKGIGPALEKLCHSLGYYHFDQIAAWTPAEVAWVDDNLEGFKGRVTRDEWVAQAKALAAGGTVG